MESRRVDGQSTRTLRVTQCRSPGAASGHHRHVRVGADGFSSKQMLLLLLLMLLEHVRGTRAMEATAATSERRRR